MHISGQNGLYTDAVSTKQNNRAKTDIIKGLCIWGYKQNTNAPTSVEAAAEHVAIQSRQT